MSEPGRAEALRATQKIARIAVAAAKQQFPPQALVDVLQRFHASAFGQPFIGLDHTFSWMGVQLVCPRGVQQGSVLEYLAEFHSARIEATERLLGRRGDMEFIELRLAADGEIGATVHSIGACPVEDDLALVRDLTELSADSDMLLNALVRQLVSAGGVSQGMSDGDDGVTTLRFALGNADDKEMTATLAVLTSVASGLQASDAQLGLLRSGHRGLCLGGACIAGISIKNQRLMMGLALEYAPMSWQNSKELMLGLHPDAPAIEKLAILSDTCNSEHVSLVRLDLGPAEPPGLQVWAQLAAPSTGVRSQGYSQ